MALMANGNEPRENLDGRFMIAQDGTPPTESQITAQQTVRFYIGDVAERINRDIADSREKSLALTKLEEALMWAGKAIFKEK